MKKKSIVLFLMLFTFQTLSCISQETKPCENTTLSETYISRGEDLLISGKYLEAMNDLQEGYRVASHCEKDLKLGFQLRALFALLFVYGNLEQMENMRDVASEMHVILTYCQCNDCEEKQSSLSLDYSYNDKRLEAPSIYLISNTYQEPNLLGPDKVSVEDCLDMVYRS